MPPTKYANIPQSLIQDYSNLEVDPKFCWFRLNTIMLSLGVLQID